VLATILISMRPRTITLRANASRSHPSDLTKPLALSSDVPVHDETMHVLIFVATPDAALKRSLRVLLDSLSQHHESQTIQLHLACDHPGCAHCIHDGLTNTFNTTLHPLQSMVNASVAMLGSLRALFSIKPESHYAKELFTLSLVMHTLLPTLPSLLVLDADLKVTAPLWSRWHQLDRFSSAQGFGLSYEQQPVYRHVFAAFRKQHPATTVGDPPATGFPGFNSGVLLLNLDHLRRSATYNALFNSDTMQGLAQSYQFRGHLGDQDFYSLLYTLHPELFAVLSCGYNRQLCTWWQQHHVYSSVFEAYHRCDEHVLVWHANCKSQLP